MGSPLLGGKQTRRFVAQPVMKGSGTVRLSDTKVEATHPEDGQSTAETGFLTCEESERILLALPKSYTPSN